MTQGGEKPNFTGEAQIVMSLGFLSGQSRDRTGDTRIFSPVLYQLSYLPLRNQEESSYEVEGGLSMVRCG